MSDYTEVHIRILKDLHSRLKLLAAERGVTQRSLIVSAIKDFIGMDEDEEQKKKTGEQLRRDVYEVKRRLSALREDVEILGELLSFFIYHWIGYTPRLSREERISLAAEAKERHERFMALFAKKLSVGELSLSSLLAKGLSREDAEPQTNDVKGQRDELQHDEHVLQKGDSTM
jgi:hypothetical protein